MNRIKCYLLFFALLAGNWTCDAMDQQYIWRNVAIGGGGFVTGIVFQPGVKNLMYARTDVGGAYRWDDVNRMWIPLLDWIGPAENNLMGVESIAIDPTDTNRVYLAVGTYGRGKAAILRSNDKGQTFQRTDVPFKMGGNETGRFNGERLSVNPDDSKILFFGSRRDGLWKSVDRGVTWAKVDGFPYANDFQNPTMADVATNSGRHFGPASSVGIVSVVFGPAKGKVGKAPPKMYVAVSTLKTNLYSSEDGGVTWRPVTNQPVGLRPNHMVLSSEGTLYLTYGKEPGPNSMTDGEVWKYITGKGTWTNITPLEPHDAGLSFGYGSVAIDARHPSTIMVTTFAHWHPHDLMFRSTDAGAHWNQIWRDDTIWSHGQAPYTKSRTPHWMGTIAINPANSDEVLFTTGYGIWCCMGATRSDLPRPTEWDFLDRGLEETVPLALISPPLGAHLLSGLGDIDGFRHDDLDHSPEAGTFAGPRYANTETLAFAFSNPAIVVRAGTAGNQLVRAAYSLDGGEDWEQLKNEPPSGNGGGYITIASDAKTIVWTPRGGKPYLTKDWGMNWTACFGLSTGFRVVADTVNPRFFYTYDSHSGIFYSSTNGAASFAAVSTVPGIRENRGFGSGGGPTVTSTPGVEKDLWLTSSTEGLLHSTNGGAKFERLERVQSADSLGLGKPAPGKNFPALFLAGTIGGLQALFRSDDVGESWVRINDDQHQYGYISHVSGDPRIYGRVYCATGGRGIVYGDINSGLALGKTGDKMAGE